MAQPKLITMHSLLAELEASYGSGGTPSTAEDGVLTENRAEAEISYIHDGAHDAEAARGVPLKRAQPSGRTATFPVGVIGRGAGAAYSATVTPPFIHDLLRAAGFAATLNAGVGTESYTYTPEDPTVATLASIFGTIYSRGQQWPYDSGFANLEIVISAAGFIRFNFDVSALLSADPSDIAIPLITYSTQAPPKVVNTGLKIGLFTAAVWSEIRIAMNRVIAPRADGNSAGHSGYVAGGFEPSWEIDMETADLAAGATPTATAINPHKMFDAAETVALEVTVGSTQYNRVKVSTAQAQLASNPDLGEDDPRALWTLVFEPKASAVGLLDFLTILFD